MGGEEASISGGRRTFPRARRFRRPAAPLAVSAHRFRPVLPDTLTLFARLGAALAIGLLVGTQRQFAKHREQGVEDLFAGVRTFALLALAGGLGAYAAALLGSPLVFAATMAVGGGLIVVAYMAGVKRGDIGLTTEVAALVTLFAGALCAWGELATGAAVGVVTTVLLALKVESESLVRNLTREDVAATLKFAVITLLVLPLLPDATYGPPPFDVVSPFKVWLMVVFISGISFLGYVLVKTVGARRGVGLTGLLGGLASSTAVTLTFASRSKGQQALVGPIALGLVIAWTTMFGRVLVVAGAVNPALLASLWLPIVGGGVAGLAYAAFLWVRHRNEADAPEDEMSFVNPFELGPALTFGLLYGVILVVARAAELYFGEAGIYAAAVASGLADVNAITLSLAEMSRGEGALSHDTATLGIVLATMSNTLVKGGIVVALGSGALRRTILPAVGLILATALGLAVLL